MLENNENQENSNNSNYYENSNSNTTDSNNNGASEGSDDVYSRSYYKSPYEDSNTTFNTTTNNSVSGGGTGNNNNKKKNNKGEFGKKLAVVATLSVIGGGLAGASFEGVRYISNNMNQAQVASVDLSGVDATADASQTIDNTQNTDGAESIVGTDSTINSTTTTQLATTVSDVSSVVEAVVPSVVSITNVGTMQVQVPDFFGTYGNGTEGNTYEQQQESSGSGIIIGKNDTELLIVTNNHVVADSTTLSIGFVDDSVVDAKIKGTDADSDLAVIAVTLSDIDSDTLSKIAVAELGDSDQLKVGEVAIAIGNALGYGQSVTTGVISATEREVTVDNVTSSLLQTDAAINPGNSGGALLNMQGQVIGINSLKYSSTDVEGMGYAIPISAAIPIINELVTKETKDKVDSTETGYLGIAGVDVSEEASSTYNMPTGVYVAQVIDGSAAQTAGIKKGDIITKFDGSSVSSMETLQDTLQYYAAGTDVAITVQSAQDGEYVEKDITVTLGRKVG
ncbi:MAG: S1C family serine protease [Lachnotalea sp.]